MKKVLKLAFFSAVIASFGFQVQAGKEGHKHHSVGPALMEFHEAGCMDEGDKGDNKLCGKLGMHIARKVVKFVGIEGKGSKKGEDDEEKVEKKADKAEGKGKGEDEKVEKKEKGKEKGDKEEKEEGSKK